PLYGFYADVLVPPEVVVFSKKRLLTGQLTPEVILELLKVYSPGQVLFARFPREVANQPPIAHYLQQKYRQVSLPAHPDVKYFVKSSIE
ncbi:MAG: hypothetical protein VKL39_15130, partial [Leptolyngbyaceae bacterium]|nr:hypothetical protein [Leptolyngbyaceae bacterium]